MKERSRTEYSLLNIFAGIGGYFINTVIGFVCRMVFVKCLSEDYLGVNGLFTNILMMLSLAELGIGNAIVFALYKPLAEHDEEKIASLVNFYGKAYRIIGISVGIIGILLLPFLSVIINNQPNIKESIYLLYLINLFNTASTYFFSYRSSLIIAAQQNYIVASVNYLVTILQSVVQIVVLLLTRNYLLYLLIQTLGTFIYNYTISRIAVINFPYIKKKHVKPLEDDEKKSLFSNIRDLMIYKVSGLLVNSTDNILITFFKGLATTGIASNYTLLVNTLNTLLNQIFNGLTASVGNHNAIESNENKYDMFCFLNFMNFWIFGWATLGIIFCSTDLVQLCFGKKYVLSIEIPLVMALNFYTVGLSNAVWTYKHTMGLFHYGRFMQIFTGILNIAFSVYLGNKWGLFGILFATFVARFFTNLWYDPYAVYKYGFHKSPFEYVKKYLHYLLVLAIAFILCKLSFAFINTSLILTVILKIIICSLITNIVFIVCFYRSKEFSKFKSVFGNVFNILKRHISRG